MTDPSLILDLPLPAEDDRSARAASLRSRAAVEAGDRAGWLAIFAEDGVVQDPVGPSMFDEAGLGHRGPEARAAFWDKVIAPNPVQMRIHASYAGGDEVCNVITIVNRFPDGSQALVPGVATYCVDGAGKVVSLRAFWELEQMVFEPAPT
ncbi:nuclear transport factor 2 family protein [soil metagenome]